MNPKLYTIIHFDSTYPIPINKIYTFSDPAEANNKFRDLLKQYSDNPYVIEGWYNSGECVLERTQIHFREFDELSDFRLTKFSDEYNRFHAI